MEEYVERIPQDKRNIKIPTDEIDEIADKIIRSWEPLALLLKLSDDKVEIIKNDHRNNYNEQKLALRLL